MTLLEAIRDLDTLSGDVVIYAREPWTRESACVLSTMDAESAVVPADEAAKARGYAYFIEVFIIHEVFDGWRPEIDREPTAEELCDRVIHYAIYDA